MLQKLFDIRFSYKHCNFSHGCLLVKMASKTVIRPIELKLSSEYAVNLILPIHLVFSLKKTEPGSWCIRG